MSDTSGPLFEAGDLAGAMAEYADASRALTDAEIAARHAEATLADALRVASIEAHAWVREYVAGNKAVVAAEREALVAMRIEGATDVSTARYRAAGAWETRERARHAFRVADMRQKAIRAGLAFASATILEGGHVRADD